MSLNKVFLIGNVGKDPEIRHGQSGSKVAQFSVAISERWKDKSSGEFKTKTEWVSVAAFGYTVDFIENYLKKGDKVFVEGAIKTDSYINQKGEKVFATKVIASSVQSLESKQKAGDESPKAKAPVPKRHKMDEELNNDEETVDDEIPF